MQNTKGYMFTSIMTHNTGLYYYGNTKSLASIIWDSSQTVPANYFPSALQEVLPIIMQIQETLNTKWNQLCCWFTFNNPLCHCFTNTTSSLKGIPIHPHRHKVIGHLQTKHIFTVNISFYYDTYWAESRGFCWIICWNSTMQYLWCFS